ncbi:MAG: biopolymer transporter ExbD [Candidatus Sulfotelmatobacter sp.]|jgi:biopolymer transport protein ExbD/biopolymer transport protein TolR
MSPRLFSDFNTLQFASVMAMVVFVILLVFMTIPTHHHGVSADLPEVSHPIPMPGALREDAMLVTITRDGKAFFGSEQINVINLPTKVQDCLKDRGVERKVYVVADMRARWGTVKDVLDGVRAGGIIRVAFLANQRRCPIVPH